MNDTLRDWVTIVGFLATITGMIYAIVQVRKTQGAVEASKKAIQSTQQKIQNNVLMIDVIGLVRTIDHIRDHLMSGRLEQALFFLRQVRSDSQRLVAFTRDNPRLNRQLKNFATQIAEADYQIEQSLDGGRDALDTLPMSRVLAELADVLNNTYGGAAYSAKNEDSNARS